MVVKLSPKKPKNNKRRLAIGWSSLFARSNKKNVKVKPHKSWRAKRRSISFGRYKSLVITRRKFRTKQSNRPKSYKQFVLIVNNYPFPTREIAFRFIKRGKKTKVTSQQAFRLRPQLALPILLIIIGLSGTLFFGLQTIKSDKLEPIGTFSLPTPQVVSAEPEKPKYLDKSEPKHVRIARLGIDYATIPVGKLADGTMETPPIFDVITGWYKYSPTPGEIGPSVIVGHVDTYKGPSVFWRLREVVAGDIVEISRADGQTVKFKVESLKQFDQANFPTEEVYGNINHAGLRLITCGGTFNRATGHYTENTVVFASLVI